MTTPLRNNDVASAKTNMKPEGDRRLMGLSLGLLDDEGSQGSGESNDIKSTEYRHYLRGLYTTLDSDCDCDM